MAGIPVAWYREGAVPPSPRPPADATRGEPSPLVPVRVSPSPSPSRQRRASRTPSRAVRVRRTVPLAALVGATALPAGAQTLDDGLMIPARQLRLGVTWQDERWDRYWEGTRRRENGNIGTLTTRAVVPTLGYGVTGRLGVFAALPHVRTSASAGVLQGMRGWQDVTVGAKLGLLDRRVARRATLGAAVLASAAAPASDYTPDLLPMSVGLGARRAGVRGTLHLQDRTGLFAEAAAGHTWRSTVRLDRQAYYTDGRLVLADEVAMPDVADAMLAVGYQGHGLCLPVMLVAQRTRGGGDIRRQDMPFPSNRMDFTRVHARAMYVLPRLPAIQLELGAARTLAGRNVGQSTLLSAGLTTAFGL